MARYLEYDKSTGHIISEIISGTRPKISGNYDILEIPDELEVNTALYAIRDNQLVKLYETNEERLERERVRQEYGEQIRSRVKTMKSEAVIAILDDNEGALNELKKEYRGLKVYL